MQEKRSKPLLSISLLSSGRKETIWKCLDSLRPIQEAIASELIIVDTGCDEETHNRMLSYTEQVIRFTWCNDFSTARNAGLKRARGEWFMFIDDDEWFTDVEELVTFFTTGEYKAYGVANYIQRNYTHKSGKRYKDAWVTRLIRLDKDTRFMSSIHEYLYPVKGECKLLHSPVDHYGYVFKNNQEKYAHSKRNISLLVEMIKKERGNPRWWVHLAQEYKGIGEYHKLEELCREGIVTFERINAPLVNSQRGTFYVGHILVELRRRDYEKAKEYYEKYLGDERNTQVCRARLYGLGAEIYYMLKEYEACEDCCKRYLEIYEKLHEQEMECIRQASFFVREGFEAGVYNNVCGLYMGCALKRGDSRILKDYFYRLNWEAKAFTIFSSTPADIVEGMARLPYEEDFVGMAATMMRKKGIDRAVIRAIREMEEKEDTEDTKETDTKETDAKDRGEASEFRNICRIFAQIEDSANPYVLYVKLRYLDELEDREPMEEIYHKLFRKVVNLWDLKDSFFKIAMKNHISLENVFRQIKFEQWKKGVDMLFEKGSREKLELRKRVLDELCPKGNIRFSYFYLKWAEWECREPEEEITYPQLRESLEEFSHRYLQFYRQFFKDSAFSGEMEMLPPPCRLAVRLTRVLEEEKKENINGMKEALKACFKVYPPMDSTLQRFARLYGEHKKRELEEQALARTQLEKLGAQIREKVEELLARRLYGEAYPIWQQLVMLLPEDEEVFTLGERIKGGLS